MQIFAQAKRGKFTSVVFAGGGCRCVWQTGFWQVAAKPLGLQHAVIGSVSAGAAMACVVRADRIDDGLAAFKFMFARNPRNFYPRNLLRNRPVFPQVAIYRQGLAGLLDEQALVRLRQSPPVRILLTQSLPRLDCRAAALVGMMVYSLEKTLRRPVHPRWTLRLGFRPQVVVAQSCETPRQLSDLILQSSCTPPIVPVQYRDNRAVLDGGLIDNVPVLTVADIAGRCLVLLTRRYPGRRFPQTGRFVYLQPSRTPPISRWDYTNAVGLQQTFDLGRADGQAFLRRMGVA